MTVWILILIGVMAGGDYTDARVYEMKSEKACREGMVIARAQVERELKDEKSISGYVLVCAPVKSTATPI